MCRRRVSVVSSVTSSSYSRSARLGKNPCCVGKNPCPVRHSEHQNRKVSNQAPPVQPHSTPLPGRWTFPLPRPPHAPIVGAGEHFVFCLYFEQRRVFKNICFRRTVRVLSFRMRAATIRPQQNSTPSASRAQSRPGKSFLFC
jgi:hypothetical protein